MGGCSPTGSVYGGGDGLTLSTDAGEYTWPGAVRSQLLLAKNDRAFDPAAFAYAPLDDPDGWFVRVRGDAFTANDAWGALGLACAELATDYDVWIGSGGLAVSYTTIAPLGTTVVGEVGAYATSEGGLASADALAGSGTLAVSWSQTIEGCDDGQFPAEFSVDWAFDESVQATTRACPGCGSDGSLFDIPIDITL